MKYIEENDDEEISLFRLIFFYIELILVVLWQIFELLLSVLWTLTKVFIMTISICMRNAKKM
jgi:hypothetical protein